MHTSNDPREQVVYIAHIVVVPSVTPQTFLQKCSNYKWENLSQLDWVSPKITISNIRPTIDNNGRLKTTNGGLGP